MHVRAGAAELGRQGASACACEATLSKLVNQTCLREPSDARCHVGVHAHAKVFGACVSTWLRLSSVGICLTGRALYAGGDVKTQMIIDQLN